MNILHISPYYPDTAANHAGGVCMGKEIEALSKHNKVYVLSFISQEFDKELAKKHAGDKDWQAVKISRITRMFHVLTEPWMPNYFAARSSFRFALKLISMVRKYHIDAIHAEYASMGQYMWIKKLYPRLIFNLTEHDMTAQSFERKLNGVTAKTNKINADKGNIDIYPNADINANTGKKRCRSSLTDRIKAAYYKDQHKKIIKHESRYCLKADTLFTFNEKDAGLIHKYYGREKVCILNPYCGIEDSVFEMPADKSLREPGNICFLGQMARPENNEAAIRLIDICSELRARLFAAEKTDAVDRDAVDQEQKRIDDIESKLKLYIVGNKPTEELTKRAESANNVSGEKWITVTGFVEDVDIYLKRAQAAVFPLTHGAGIKVKVLRSMALGTPVITGQVGAEGIDESGRVIRLAETDEEFISCMQELLADIDGSCKLGEKSREYVKERFLWEKSERLLEEVYS